MVFPICCFYVLLIMSTIFSHMSLLLLPQFPCVHYIYPTTLHAFLKAFHVVLMVPIYLSLMLFSIPPLFPSYSLPKSYSFDQYSMWAMEMLYLFYLGSVQHWEMFQNSEIFFVVHLLLKSSKFIHVEIRFFREKFIGDAHYHIMFSTLDVHTTN
jgi:hypothetical protein